MAPETRATHPSCEPHPPVPGTLHMPGHNSVPPKEGVGNNIFYGCILQRVLRWCKTLKRVECVYHLARPRVKLTDLFCSNSLIQVFPWQFCAVPMKLFDLCVHHDERELTHMRYSAATGDPNGFTLRQVHYDPPLPNRAIHRHDRVQRGRQPIYQDYAGCHEEHSLVV